MKFYFGCLFIVICNFIPMAWTDSLIQRSKRHTITYRICRVSSMCLLLSIDTKTNQTHIRIFFWFHFVDLPSSMSFCTQRATQYSSHHHSPPDLMCVYMRALCSPTKKKPICAYRMPFAIVFLHLI